MSQPNINDFESFIGRGKNDYPKIKTPRLGVVVGGSISRGLLVKLDAGVNIESLAVGRYVVVQGEHKRFFCMVSDVTLNSTNPNVQADPPNMDNAFLRAVYTGTVAYSLISVTPMLVIEDGAPRPVKTIPSHFTTVYSASEEDVNDVFGKDGGKNFNIGSPLELDDTQVNLNLERLVQRSVGVFGKSGTGKSFLTRVLLAGVIAREVGVTLIFDMHNDYGWEVNNEDGTKVKGLRQLFPSQVSVMTLDAESSQRRDSKVDAEIFLNYKDIEPEDIAALRGTLNLSDAMIDAAYTIYKRWGVEWISTLLSDNSLEEIEELINSTSIMQGTLDALRRRLERFERWDFMVQDNRGDSVKQIIQKLVAERKSVVLEFGRYGNSLDAYMLVANYLTRRIHHEYVERMETSLGDNSMKPPQLMITIEEAHKFLDPQVASQTTFGIIAREMRKYNVTLLIIDQRPSMIDEEVMSQIGTRVTALLDNERDVNAVLNGISGAASLREVLARLETKQQAIIMGHAVPMPVVIRPRSYNEDFYKALQISPINANQALGGGGKKRL